jgi:NADH:ubiquinone oxidoreductase subunit F (NADH-binding)
VARSAITGEETARMQVSRVLDQQPVTSLADHIAAGGGPGLDAARRVGPDAVIDCVAASGLRGRGGAGFPTGRKWQTIRAFASSTPATVVVNAAEGEPGSFKDRAILRANPYRVLEGALIAAHAVGADRVIVALKGSFDREERLLRAAVTEIERTGWLDTVSIEVLKGPEEYLLGEETALLEVLDGRAPFPRVSPPWRHGADEVGAGAESVAALPLSRPGGHGAPPPTLVNNTETRANVPAILAEGPDWFRSVGTAESPGTIVCTVSGDTARAAVVELAMGTPLRHLLETVGGGARKNRRLVAAISGVATGFVPADQFDVPLSHEGLAAIGSGLGAAGFMAFDDRTDLVAVVAGISRFLAVESCGQCTPCKQDGRAIADVLARLVANEGSELDVLALADRSRTVSEGARCFLALQHEAVITSALAICRDELDRHARGEGAPVEVRPIAPMSELDGTTAVIDLRELDKQPDWTYDDVDSGKSPADRIDQRAAGT